MNRVNYRNLAVGDRIGHDDNTINTDISITTTTTTTTHGFCSTNLCLVEVRGFVLTYGDPTGVYLL